MKRLWEAYTQHICVRERIRKNLKYGMPYTKFATPRGPDGDARDGRRPPAPEATGRSHPLYTTRYLLLTRHV